jgi:hypothetical protein
MAIKKEGMTPIHNLLAKKEVRKKVVPPEDATNEEDTIEADPDDLN